MMGVASGRMSPDRLSVVLAAMASVDGDAPSVVDRVCVAAVALLSLSGAGISLMAKRCAARQCRGVRTGRRSDPGAAADAGGGTVRGRVGWQRTGAGA